LCDEAKGPWDWLDLTNRTDKIIFPGNTMQTNTTKPPPPPTPDASGQPPAQDFDPVAKNTESILAFYSREEKKITTPQRILESVSEALGSPIGLATIMMLVAIWMVANGSAKLLGKHAFDPPPFPWLQGLVGLGAFFITIVVLVKQNRLEKMEERRAHLELHVNLLTEQKVTKIINLLEELRRDLPMIKDRHDPEAHALQLPTDPESVLASLEQRSGDTET
jgi:uncharacterized membrane protein